MSPRADLLLAQAQPVSVDGSASAVADLRGEKLQWNSSWERGARICERRSPADTGVSEEGGTAGAPDTRAEVPLQPAVSSTVHAAVEVGGGAGGCALGGAAASCQDCGPVERGAHGGQILKSCSLGRTRVGEVCARLSPVGGSPCWSRKESKEDGLTETERYELTTTRHLSPCAAAGMKMEELVKMSLGRRKNDRGMVVSLPPSLCCLFAVS